MHDCMTLTFSNTVFKNCDSILVLLLTDQFAIQNDGRYIIEVTPPYPEGISYF